MYNGSSWCSWGSCGTERGELVICFSKEKTMILLILFAIAFAFVVLFDTGEEWVGYFSGLIMGFIVFTWGGAPAAGKPVRWKMFPSLKFKFGNRILHVHHWMWLSLLLIVLVSVQVIPPSIWRALLYGLIGGGVVHGLSYEDRFNIVYKE